jgi:hypothetical protein
MPPEDAEESVVCASCESENPASANFCASCGKPLREQENSGEHENAKPPNVAPAASAEQTPAKTVLSDPAIRFQELLKVTLFRSLLDDKNVRLKEEEVEDG